MTSSRPFFGHFEGSPKNGRRPFRQPFEVSAPTETIIAQVKLKTASPRLVVAVYNHTSAQIHVDCPWLIPSLDASHPYANCDGVLLSGQLLLRTSFHPALLMQLAVRRYLGLDTFGALGPDQCSRPCCNFAPITHFQNGWHSPLAASLPMSTLVPSALCFIGTIPSLPSGSARPHQVATTQEEQEVLLHTHSAKRADDP